VGGVPSLEQALAQAGLTPAQAASLKPRLVELAQSALVEAMSVAFRVAAAVVFVGAVIAGFVVRRRDYERGGGAPAGG
jgi:hypothetical protein